MGGLLKRMWSLRSQKKMPLVKKKKPLVLSTHYGATLEEKLFPVSALDHPWKSILSHKVVLCCNPVVSDILEQKTGLVCDWNSFPFCVTPQRYNRSAHTWDKIRYHLKDLKKNMFLDTHALRNNIVQIFWVSRYSLWYFSPGNCKCIAVSQPKAMVAKPHPGC